MEPNELFDVKYGDVVTIEYGSGTQGAIVLYREHEGRLRVVPWIASKGQFKMASRTVPCRIVRRRGHGLEKAIRREFRKRTLGAGFMRALYKSYNALFLCPKCKGPLQDGAFCPECSRLWACPDHKVNLTSDGFCRRCGPKGGPWVRFHEDGSIRHPFKPRHRMPTGLSEKERKGKGT